MASPAPPHVVIVGAGPAGAALAYLLARRGTRITLLERQVDFEREFRGEVLMPTGIDIFAQMGLGKALDTAPHQCVGGLELYRGVRRVLSLPIPAGIDIRAVSQPPMLEMLVAEAARSPNFTLERGATVRDLIRDGAGRVIGVTADTAKGTHEFRADFVIGADGRASVIRKRSGLPQERTPQAFDVVWFKIPSAGFMTNHFARAHLWPGHFVLAIPTYGNQIQLAWIIEKGSFGEIRRMGARGWLDRMVEYVSPDFADHLRAQQDSLSHPFLLDVICDRLTKWTAPGLLLLGDASHPMSPVGGQGINIALRDAIVAANQLCPALAAGGDPAALDAAAHRIETERIPEIVRVQDLQQIGPRLLFRKSPLSHVVLSAPVMSFLRTRLFASLFASNFGVFFNGAMPVRLTV
jgi:2-polyprenyl-6-methoxyphenol hydroxylase-like FAD-dependent oxidoreductase